VETQNNVQPAAEEKKPLPFAGNKKLWIALAAAVVIIVIIAAVLLAPEYTTLEEAYAMSGQNRVAHVTLYQGSAFEQQVSTYEAGKIWEAICDSEIQILDAKNNSEIKSSVLESEHILCWAYGADSIYLYVSKSGQVYVEHYPDAGGVYYASYQKGEAIYQALRSFLPTGGVLTVDEVLPDKEWTEAGIYLYINGERDSVVTIDEPDEIAALEEGLRTLEFPYGGAEEEIIEPLTFTLDLRTEDWLETEEAYYFHFNQDGNGEAWIGKWSRSVSGGEDLMIYLTDFLSNR